MIYRTHLSAFRTILLISFLSVACGSYGHAQGCTQCQDNTAATPVTTQRAYRTAILLVGGAAVSLGTLVLLIGRRFR